MNHAPIADFIPDAKPASLPNRGLNQDTLRKYGYGIAYYRGQPCHVAPYYRNGRLIAQHVRLPDKQFAWVGKPDQVELFGQHLWQGGGKFLVITEGEIDAMSVCQVQGLKWPVVSVPNGAASAAKAIKANLEWIETFEKVVFLFDNDEPGRQAAAECAILLTPGKALIGTLSRKDANECLVDGLHEELSKVCWTARQFRPDGIVAGVDLWDTVAHLPAETGKPYPWNGLNEKLGGLRPGEMVMLTAGTGVGKSEIMRAVAYSLLMQGETIGYIALEEPVRRTAIGLMGLHIGKRLNDDEVFGGTGEEELRAAFESTVGSGRVYLYDHFGSTDMDNLLSRIRYMVRGLGCRWIVLDHISIVVSGSELSDERKALDVLATRLRSAVAEMQFGLLAIVHLRRVGTQSKSHEEGGRVKLADIRGTQAIAQLSDVVIGLERDQQSESPDVTGVRVLKNRPRGLTGFACSLRYDRHTGLLTEDSVDYFAEDDHAPF